MDNYRNLLGEDLDTLDIKELERLEKQLDSSLKHIRSTRVLKILKVPTSYKCIFCELCVAPGILKWYVSQVPRSTSMYQIFWPLCSSCRHSTWSISWQNFREGYALKIYQNRFAFPQPVNNLNPSICRKKCFLKPINVFAEK